MFRFQWNLDLLATKKYLKDHTLTLGEIFTIESDPENVSYDNYIMKFISTEEDTVGHIPQHLSEVCFRFVEDGG